MAHLSINNNEPCETANRCGLNRYNRTAYFLSIKRFSSWKRRSRWGNCSRANQPIWYTPERRPPKQHVHFYSSQDPDRHHMSVVLVLQPGLRGECAPLRH
ncbi:unnamed protein product [Ectocarpus sp. 12 AP-2014]